MQGVRAVGLVLAVAAAGCAREAEVVVRDRASSEFACAEYALTVEEVAPDLYRAAGCGQELIYSCHKARPARPRHAEGATPAESDDFADRADDGTTVCARGAR